MAPPIQTLRHMVPHKMFFFDINSKSLADAKNDM